MCKPTILTVDDDPLDSAAITRDPASRYGADIARRIVVKRHGWKDHDRLPTG